MLNEKIEIDILIIGAGVVGIACAYELSMAYPDLSILLIEKHQKFGQEASSRNSEVIHAGLYYKKTPEKELHCLVGKNLLYEFCTKHKVNFEICGKYIVGFSDSQNEELEWLYQHSIETMVPLEKTDPSKVALAIKNPLVQSALWSPTTGIVDSHDFMQTMLNIGTQNGVMVLYQHCFAEVVDRFDDLSIVKVEDVANKNYLEIQTKCIVNAGGLSAAQIYQKISGLKDFSTKACRGRYYGIANHYSSRFPFLVYPLPDPAGGLGVHVTRDLQGQCRLGPDVQWPSTEHSPEDWVHYQFDHSSKLQEDFLRAGQRIIPDLKIDELSPSYVGVRCKLFKDLQAHPDFKLKLTENHAIHLLGVESPGLTASLSIANSVKKWVHSRGI